MFSEKQSKEILSSVEMNEERFLSLLKTLIDNVDSLQNNPSQVGSYGAWCTRDPWRYRIAFRVCTMLNREISRFLRWIAVGRHQARSFSRLLLG